MKVWTIVGCAVLVASALLCGCSQSSTSKRVAAIAAGASPPSNANDPSHVIDRLVIGEDTDFAGVQGDLTKESGQYAYYRSTTPLPGASSCSVYVYKPSNDRFATCEFDARNRGAANALYQKWLSNIRIAEPYWKELQVSPLPSGAVDATLFTDDKQIDGIYVNVAKSSGSRYRITITFAKMAALKS